MATPSHQPDEAIKRSLRIKLARLVAAVVLITSGVLILGGFLSLRSILREDAKVRLETELVGRQRLLNSYVRQQFERAKLVASRTRLRKLLSDYAAGSIDSDSLIPQTTRIITDARDSTSGFIDIWITDAKGKVITSTDPKRIGESFADHVAFSSGRTAPVMLPPQSNGAIHRSIVASPIIFGDDQFLGVLMVAINATDMHQLLKADLLEKETTDVLVGMKRGAMIEVFFAPSADRSMYEPKSVPALAAALEGNIGFDQVTDLEGHEVLAAYRPVGYGGWGLVVKIHAAEAYAPIATVRMWALIVAALVMLVSILLAFLTAARFSKPIQRLTVAATALADGNYSARAQITSDDEIGVLGQVFNDTAAALQKHREHLEELVKQRTAELQTSVGELEDSRAVYRALVEGLPLHIFRKDAEGTFVFCNERFAGSMDRTVDEVIGKTDYDFFPNEQAEKYRADDQRLMDTKSTFHDIEAHMEHGLQHYAEVVKTPVYDHRGQVIGIQGAFWDVTDRKRAQEALAANEAMTRLIIDKSLDAFVAMDSEGAIVDWNPQASKTFGWSHEEAMGQKVSETIIPKRFRADHKRGLATFLETGEGPVLDQRFELVAQHKEGHEFPIEVTITAIEVNGSHRFNAFVHDITPRKKREQALHATQAELESAKNAAESANQAKSDFLANMSHEIRTPMNGVLGMLELLANTSPSSEQDEYLKLARGSAEALLDILNDILDFSKIDAGKLELDPHPFELRDVIGDTLQTLSLRASQKGLELVYRIPSAVPDHLVGDLGRLRQVLVNLVGNAIKFTNAGEVLVDIGVEDMADGRIVLHFKVSDTGIGINEEKQAAVFEAFAQADTSTTREYGGTGLGLAISRQLVQLMGGRIWVESEIAKGSTFHFLVPFERGSGVEELTPPTPEELKDLPVLIVDDNATNRLILEEMLRSWNMKPQSAESADTAIALVDQIIEQGGRIGIVLMDAMMPNVDGLELARLLRERPALEAVPMLLLSSGTRPEDVARARQVGVARCLTKPVKPSDLLDAMIHALSGKTSPQMAEVTTEQIATVARPLDVLLAEDTRVNQQVAVRLLEKRGHLVEVVDNGKQAVARCCAKRFDAVLMDVQMPEMDGLEATAAIRQAEQATGDHVPIIAMTAHALKGDRQRCIDAGMDDYLSKPVHANELYRVLEFNADPTNESKHRETAPVSPKPSDSGAPSKPKELRSRFTLFNLHDALNHVGDDIDLLRELAAIYLHDIGPMMDLLASAIEQEDKLEARRVAHAVKGLSLNFGATGACENAAALEAQAKEGNWPAIRPRWENLQKQVATLVDELTIWCSQ